jgi:formylglycine-generating enzyme required for sulfatase activity
MVVVPAGEFKMGTDGGQEADEKPRHSVTIPAAFAVSRFEVTSDEWDACFLLGGCKWPAPNSGWDRGKVPVVNVNWADAEQFVAWISKRTGKTYRLLSESEWEYAARAGSETAYSWGDEVGEGHANCDGCGGEGGNKQPTPVGSFPANAFGLYDMHGNVSEWVHDCYVADYDDAPTDGSANLNGDCSHRVVRGGSWYDLPNDLRSAARDEKGVTDRVDDRGFRIARTLPR